MALVQRKDTILRSDTGIAYAGVRVRAYTGPSDAPVFQQLYSDAIGTPVSEVVTNTNGLYAFWIEEGDYTLRFTYGDALLGDDDYALFSLTKVADLASATPTKGGALVGHQRSSLSAAQYRTLSEKADDRFDLRDMLGCDLTGANDMAATLTAAFTDAKATGDTLHVPIGVIALGSPVAVQSGVNVLGVGTRPYTTLADGGSRGPGAWFHITHGGVGFTCANAGEFATGISFSKIGTFRDQPVPVSGWVPNDHDFDFTVDNCDIEFDDVMLLNATRGIRQLDGPAGRIYIRKVRGQPFLTGIQIDSSYDGLLMEGVRWWPFWSNDAYTRAFTKAQRVGMYLRHCDNPQISWYFNIFSKTGVRIGSGPNGVVNSANFYNLENDLIGGAGFEFDDTSDGSHVTVIGGYTYGDTGSTDAFQMNGDSSKLVMIGHKTQAIRYSAVRMGIGAGNICQVIAPDVDWNVANGGYEAFKSSPGNRIIVEGQPIMSGGNSARLATAALDQISSLEYIDLTGLAVTAQTGVVTSATAGGRVRRIGNKIDGTISATIADNGTGAGDLRIALPVNVKAGATFHTAGRNATDGRMLQVALSGATAIINAYDNSYPVATGHSISIDIDYETEDFI